MLMYHAVAFMMHNRYWTGVKSARDTAWWQDNVQELQLEKTKEFYEDFDMADLVHFNSQGETYNKFGRHHTNTFINNEQKRLDYIQLIYDSQSYRGSYGDRSGPGGGEESSPYL